MTRRRELAPDEPRPILVWEPVPDLCTPEEFERLRAAASLVDVVSPNAEELISFFPSNSKSLTRQSMVKDILGLDSENPLSTALVVREGALGCTTYVRHDVLHLNACHQDSCLVADPTGGGNTFLGALALGLTGVSSVPSVDFLRSSHSNDISKRKNLVVALLHATVAAAYAIEQVGMPAVSTAEPDTWNGVRYQNRFEEYLDRERDHITSQLQ